MTVLFYPFTLTLNARSTGVDKISEERLGESETRN